MRRRTHLIEVSFTGSAPLLVELLKRRREGFSASGSPIEITAIRRTLDHSRIFVSDDARQGSSALTG